MKSNHYSLKMTTTSALARCGDGIAAIYRIPSLIATQCGTLLASYECRASENDWESRALAMRRSIDHGKTWSSVTLMEQNDNLTVHNPTQIASKSGKIYYFYQLDYARTFLRISEDDGIHFSAPREITDAFEGFRAHFPFTVCAVGPGHGIETPDGRLILPIWLACDPARQHFPSRSATLYSDDDGKTFHCGELIPLPLNAPGTSECCLAQCAHGFVLNLRHQGATHMRAIAVSSDGISRWSVPEYAPQLPDPGCFASVVSSEDTQFYCGCLHESQRCNLEILQNISPIEARSDWLRLIRLAEYGGYADLALSPDNRMLYCFYEQDNLKRLSFSAFKLHKNEEYHHD